MKSERRHELQKNDLEQVLEKGMEQMGPQAKIVAGVAIAIVVAVIAVMWLQWQNKLARASGWGELFTASALMGRQDAEMTPALEAVGNAYQGRPAGAWAELFLGYDLYRQGLEKYFTQKDDAQLALERSVKAFQNAEKAADVPELKQRAMWGIGQSSEVLATKESIETAIATYDKLSTQWPESPFGKWASERLTLLKSQQTEEFYVWYHDQDFSPKASPTTGLFNQDLPSDPNLTLPSRDALTRPGDEDGMNSPIDLLPSSGLPQPGEGDLMPQPESPATETPADASAPTAPPTSEEKGTEEKPAAEAAPEKPAEEAPAATEEKPATEEPAKEEASAAEASE
ncbi:tetratricopeptide repeat protein [Blastopirellula marina]|uniref:Tetratricopeptide repeat-like domain-containing protein n=1 Tax=Blastopirellula marina TaxID=124 RepID=A0A2S8G702_9BACT|nr:hypothetical protein [Blastopirellula marina]PQO40236.1 hypothetical protein C5Y98_06435 [Blastopirellula marina]PTL45603.1 hypothetical protein C5Y97_06435 [Blastopirellula marina]